MEVVTRKFGTTSDGREIHLHSMWNGRVQMDVIDYGARVVRICAPDMDGSITDVALGYDNADDYLANRTSFGALMGRHAGRIDGARFVLNGEEFQLEANNNGNNLHSGKDRYSRRMWETVSADEDGVVLRIDSPDGDQGFPGNAVVTVKYSITDDNGIRIEYDAYSDKDTVFNMTNHTYFNLDGEESDSLKDHILQIDSDHITEDRGDGVPTGGIVSVKDTLYDFNVPSDLANRLGSDELSNGGYDNTYLLKGEGFRKVAYLESKKSGISLDVYTDMPAMVLYTANTLSETGRYGAHHGPLSSICLETQYVPGSIDKGDFDRCVFKAGEHFHSVTEYRFRDTYPDIEW